MRLTLLAIALAGLMGTTGIRAEPSPAAGLDALWSRSNAHYKQALYTTNIGETARAVKETAEAQAAWSELERRFAAAPPAPYSRDKAWKEMVAGVRGDLERAARLLAEGKTADAHIALEPARYRWADLRERLGLDFLGDRLTRYHDHMEAAVMLVKGKTPETLTAEERGKLRAMLPDLKASFAKVEQGRMPELPAGERARLEAALRDGRAGIGALEQALGGEDAAAVIKAAAGLKQPFMRLFLGFG